MKEQLGHFSSLPSYRDMQYSFNILLEREKYGTYVSKTFSLNSL